MTDVASLSSVSPPRFWWLKRLIAAYVLALLALAGLTACWAWRADVARKTHQARLRAEGGPATVDEVNAMGPALNEQALRDGARLRELGDAISATTRPSAASRWEDERVRGRPFSGADVKIAGPMLAAIQAQTIEAATLLDGRPLDFGVRFRSPMVGVLLPHLNGARRTADVLNDVALLQHAQGDHAGAIGTIGQILEYARQTQRPPAMIVQLSTSSAMDFHACDAIESIAGSLAIAPAAGDSFIRSVSREAILRLIQQLEDAARIDAFRDCLRVERVWLSDTVEATVGVQSPAPLRRRAFRFGYATADERWWVPALAAVDRYTRGEALSGEAIPTEPPSPTTRPARVPAAARVVAEIVFPGIRTAIVREAVSISRKRACATLLAMRLFEFDHGRLPDRLDELVPDYLAAIPRDVRAAGQPPLIYIREDDVVALYGPDRDFVRMTPTTMPRNLTPDRSQRRRRDFAVVYRGHDKVSGPRFSY